MPAAQEPKKLNAIQAERAAGIVSNDQRQADIDAMTASGTLPRGLVQRTVKVFEGAGYTVRVFYSQLEGLWKYKAVSKTDETDIIKAESRTYEGLNDLLQASKVVRERQEAERAFDDVEREAIDFADMPLNAETVGEIKRQLRDNPVSSALLEWFHTYNGAEYLSIRCDETRRMMQSMSRKLHLPMNCPENLETIYAAVADNPDDSKNFERFFAKRNRLAREAAEREADRQAGAETPEIGNPSENVRASKRLSTSRQPLVDRSLTVSQQQTAAKKLK